MSTKDLEAIELLSTKTRVVPAGVDLIGEGDRPSTIFLLLEGWAFRYKVLRSGKRQILAYLVPGDVCDIHVFVLKRMDHGIGLLSQATVATVDPESMLDIMRGHPQLERALWWAALVDEAILREWLVNLGQRDAYERVSHIFCEMWLRMRAVGLADGGQRFSLPLTQTELADMVGLTPVSVNRCLQRLRAEGLITLDQKYLTIHEPERLAAISSFEPNYLHLDRIAPCGTV